MKVGKDEEKKIVLETRRKWDEPVQTESISALPGDNIIIDTPVIWQIYFWITRTFIT